jgi:glucose-6-phosphate isomerase
MGLVQFDNRFCPEKIKEDADRLMPKALEGLRALQGGTCRGGEFTGWYHWPKNHGLDLGNQVQNFVNHLDTYCDTVVVIGIGGSYLGTRAVSDALSHAYAPFMGRTGRGPRRPHMVYIGHHLSESGLLEVLDLLEDRQPIVNVISKSGTTTEPAVAFRVIRSYLEKRFGKVESARRIIATTDPVGGALRKLALEAGYRTFEVPPQVGGRYSVLTAVGLVPLALGGFDIQNLLLGADRVFRSLDETEGLSHHPALLYATHRIASYLAGYRIELLSISEPKLQTVVEWWKQLFGESEGKEGKGLFPAGLTYTTDLHSLGQYVQDGVRNLIETFLQFEEAGHPNNHGPHPFERRLRVPATNDNTDELRYLEGRMIEEVNRAAMLGTKLAHYDGGVPCFGISVPRLSEETLGALFAFYEVACAIGSYLMDVNAFDQPGVEAYKKNLFGLLGKPGYESLGQELRSRV